MFQKEAKIVRFNQEHGICFPRFWHNFTFIVDQLHKQKSEKTNGNKTFPRKVCSPYGALASRENSEKSNKRFPRKFGKR